MQQGMIKNVVRAFKEANEGGGSTGVDGTRRATRMVFDREEEVDLGPSRAELERWNYDVTPRP
jgi:hypothetical protein